MAISHKDCEHESTPGARAKCRRKNGATPREIDFAGVEQKIRRKREQDGVPADRARQCMNCGVEKIAYRGTDPLSGILLFVGERCEYMVRRATDRQEVEV